MDTTVVPIGLRERQRRRTETELLDIGMRLFVEQGYDAVTVEHICDEARVSPRTFFRYFGSKQLLLTAPLSNFGREVLEAVAAQPADLDAWQALRAACLQACRHLQDEPTTFLRAVQVITEEPERFAGSIGSVMNGRFATAEAIVGRLPRRDAEELAVLLAGLAQAAITSALTAWTRDPHRNLVRLLGTAFARVEKGPQTLAAP